MRLHMAQIGVFCRLLFLVGHVDQKIESRTLIVSVDYRQELMFMQF